MKALGAPLPARSATTATRSLARSDPARRRCRCPVFRRGPPEAAHRPPGPGETPAALSGEGRGRLHGPGRKLAPGDAHAARQEVAPSSRAGWSRARARAGTATTHDRRPLALPGGLGPTLRDRASAVLRYDDRGVGRSIEQPRGPRPRSTSRRMRRPASRARARPEVDPPRTGVMGPQRGALVACASRESRDPQVATRWSLLAGTGVNGQRVLGGAGQRRWRAPPARAPKPSPSSGPPAQQALFAAMKQEGDPAAMPAGGSTEAPGCHAAGAAAARGSTKGVHRRELRRGGVVAPAALLHRSYEPAAGLARFGQSAPSTLALIPAG